MASLKIHFTLSISLESVFFFQAEDGIRDWSVTGVQTCALPIPVAVVKEAAELIITGGLKAEALADARPAQWSKLIFNASVNGVSALTGLPHSPHFADETQPESLGHLLHDLIEEGKRVAEAAGVRLHEDPCAMNKIGAMTNHPPSMLYDARHQLFTEVDFLSGAIAREARRAGVSAPLHKAVYQLIKGKEASWTYKEENRDAVVENGMAH